VLAIEALKTLTTAATLQQASNQTNSISPNQMVKDMRPNLKLLCAKYVGFRPGWSSAKEIELFTRQKISRLNLN